MQSHILKLPPELLSEIFINSVPNKNPCETEAPVNVSSVCKAWNQIAISTPHLWSKMYIQQRSYNVRLPPSHAIETWISRSKGCGFSFEINLGHFDVHDEDKFSEMIDALKENCETWRDVHIAIRNKYFESILSVIPMQTPNLRQLSIHGYNWSLENLFDVPLIHLTHLRLVSTTVHISCRNLLMLENLRSLQLEAFKYSDVVKCLSRSPRLEEVKASFDFTHADSQRTWDRVCFKLEHLQHLDVTVGIHDCHEELGGPFYHIQLPALKTLLLRFHSHEYRNWGISPWDFSITMVSQYEATLQNLEIKTRCYGGPQPDFIGRLRSLKHLGMQIDGLDDDFIRALVSRFSSSTKQPFQGYSCLESLRIIEYYEHDDGPTLRALIDLADKEKSSISVQPVIMVLHRPFVLPPNSAIEIMGVGDWEKRRRDLCRPFDW